MTVDTERRDAPTAPAQARTSTPATVSRRLYLPTVLAAWLDWPAHLGNHRVTESAR
jgi:hypothetical protein